MRLSINIVEDFPLLSKVRIMLGAAESYRFDLGTLTMCHEEYEAAVAAYLCAAAPFLRRRWPIVFAVSVSGLCVLGNISHF